MSELFVCVQKLKYAIVTILFGGNVQSFKFNKFLDIRVKD